MNRLLLDRNAGDDIKQKTRLLFREMDMCRFSPAVPTMDYSVAADYALELVDGLNSKR